MTNIGEEEQIAMPVMESFPKVDTCAMKSIDQRGFHQARFVNGPARTVIRARRPLDHPVKNFELAELRLPLWNALGTQIIHKGLLAGSRAHGEKRTQVFIKEIPLLFEAVESTRWFFLDGLFYGEEIFVGEFLGGHKGSLS